MTLSAIIKALADAGATPEQLAAAVRAHEHAADEKLAAKRAKDAKRQAEKRARDKAANVTTSHAESRGHGVTSRDACDDAEQKRKSPTPPKEKIPSSSLRSEEASTVVDYPIDPVERVWSEGLDHLRGMGVAERQARSMIGRWLRDVRGDAGRLLDAIRRAREFGTKDPLALIGRLLNPVSRHDVRKAPTLIEAADALADWTARADARETPTRDGTGPSAVRLLSSAGRS